MKIEMKNGLFYLLWLLCGLAMNTNALVTARDFRSVDWNERLYKTVLPGVFGNVSVYVSSERDEQVKSISVEVFGEKRLIPLDQLTGVENLSDPDLTVDIDGEKFQVFFEYGGPIRIKVDSAPSCEVYCYDWVRQVLIIAINRKGEIETSKMIPGIISVKFGDTTLDIPRVYLLPNLPASISGGGGELDDGEGISLKIPLPNTAWVVDKGLIISVIAILSPLPSGALETTVSDDVLNAWKGGGLYSNRIIKHDDAVSLYRVYSRVGYPKRWNYFKVKPVDGALDVKNWVAHCMLGPLEEESASLSNVKCKSIIFYKDIQIEISYSGVHLRSLQDLLDKVKADVSNWDVSQPI